MEACHARKGMEGGTLKQTRGTDSEDAEAGLEGGGGVWGGAREGAGGRGMGGWGGVQCWMTNVL